MIQKAALERFRKLFSDRESGKNLLSQRFVDYHVDLYDLGVPFDVYIEKAAGIVRQLRGCKRVLDLGAGFGVLSALLRILGVPEVVALDFHLIKTRNAIKLWDHLDLDGLSVLHGDATALPFQENSFDGAIALAALSHIREPEIACTEVSRIIHPGGAFFVFEDNNSTYPKYKAGMQPVWDGADTGVYPGDQPDVKRVHSAYVDIRREMIRKNYPELKTEVVDFCATHTRGLYRKEIDEAVEEYLQTGTISNPRKKIARHPRSGEYEENPLNPTIVARMLRQSGFQPRLRSPLTGPYLGKKGIVKWMMARAFELCPALLPWTWPTFVMVGVRNGNGA